MAMSACQMNGNCPKAGARAMYGATTSASEASGIQPFSATGAFVVRAGDDNAYSSELDVSGQCHDCSGKMTKQEFIEKCVEPATSMSYAMSRFAVCGRVKHFDSARGSGEIPGKISQRDGVSTSRHSLAASAAGMYGVASVEDLGDATYMKAGKANPL